MKVLEAQQTVLTNAELYRIMKEQRAKQGAVPNSQRLKVLGTVIYETTSYLEETRASVQTDDNVKSLINAVAPFNLTACEVLQLINLRPSSVIEVQLVIEECEERLTENQVDNLIAIINEHLPPRPCPADPNNEENGSDKKMET